MRIFGLLVLILSAISLLPSTQQQNCPGVVVSQNNLDGTVIQMEWFNNEQYVYAVTKLSVYVSRDEGQTWTAKALGSGTIMELYLTADPTKQFVIEYKDKMSMIWKTSDHGSTWTQLSLSELVGDLYPHPTDSNWVVAHSYTKNCLNGSQSCSQNLLLSQDFGESWKALSAGIQRFSWGDAGKNGIPKERAFQLRAENPSSMRTSPFKFERTSNLFKSVDKTVSNALDFGYYYGTLYVAEYLLSKVHLLVSNDGGDTIKAARFPSTLEEHSYTIINGIPGLSYIAVDHSDWKASVKWANLYVTDFTSDAYVLSQEYVTKDRATGKVDVAGISLDGVQITNVYVLDQEPAPTTQSIVVSMISWDNGGQWQNIQGPMGSCPSTAPQCHIHLQGRSSGFEIETSENAVGIIIATGNTGDVLDDDALNTYISRDAGLTWSFVTQGTKVYEFADHGGLLVLAEDEYATRSVLYSWDEGGSFTNCTFGTKDKLITWVGTAPSETSQNFIILQSDTDSSGAPISVLTHLDFSTLHQRECVESDYEWWRPSDGSSDYCLLGREIQFQRRKADAKCFNPKSLEAQKITSLCPCSQEDYGCDFCYTETTSQGQTTGQCVNKCGYDPAAPPADCSGTYKKTRGYRLVAGDQCSGGLNLNPQTCDCQGQNCVDSVPSTTTTTGSTTGSSSGSSSVSAGTVVGILFLILLIFAVLSAILVFYLYRNNDQVRTYVDEHIPKNLFGRSGGENRSNVPYSTLDHSQNVEVDPFVDEEEATELNDHEIVQMKTLNSHENEFNPRGDSRDSPSQPPSLI